MNTSFYQLENWREKNGKLYVYKLQSSQDLKFHEHGSTWERQAMCRIKAAKQ